MCVQRVCTMPIFGLVKWWMTFIRKSSGGTKSASKIATNSPLADFSPSRERAGLEAFAIGAVVIGDRIAQRGVALDQTASDFDGFIGRIVEQLDVEFLAWDSRSCRSTRAGDQPRTAR